MIPTSLDFSNPLTWVLVAVVVIVALVFAALSPKKDGSNPSKDPSYMEVRTNADGSASVYNYKTEETVATFPNRAEASSFLDDLKSKN